MSTPEPTAGERRRFASGKQWPWIIAGFLAIPAILDTTMIYVATTDPSFVVEDDYYTRAQNWNDEIAQRRTNAALGWEARMEFLPVLPDRTAPLRLRLSDATGTPLEGANVEVNGFAHRDARLPFHGAMSDLGDGYYQVVVPFLRHGAWKLRVSARHDDHLFVEEQTVVMP